MPRPTFDQSTTWPSGFLDTLEPAPLPPPLSPAPDPLGEAPPPLRRATGGTRWWWGALLVPVVLPVALVAAVAALPVGLLVLVFEHLHRALRRRRGDADAGRR